MVVKVFLKDEVSSIWSILSCCRSGGIQSEVVCSYMCMCLCKSVPLQAWSGPEDSRKLRFPDFATTAQDGGKVVSLTHRPSLPPGNTPGTHFS